MTTAYSFSDTLPKDAGGAKVIALINLATSQLDFSLLGGIGAKTTGSKITAALWSGNGLAGCKVEPTGGVGTVLMAHWSSATSPTATQNAIHLRADDRGALYTTSLSGVTSSVSGSTETMTTASGIIYRAIIAGCGVQAAGQVALMSGGGCLVHAVFSGANETLPVVDFGPGACFGSLRVERRNTVGTVYVTAVFKNYGQ